MLCDPSCKAADSLHYIRTHFIDRFSLDIYSLPYGSPQRRINNDLKKEKKTIHSFQLRRIYSKFATTPAVQLGVGRINEYVERDRAWEDVVVAVSTMCSRLEVKGSEAGSGSLTRKITTLIIGHRELDTIVNDYGECKKCSE